MGSPGLLDWKRIGMFWGLVVSLVLKGMSSDVGMATPFVETMELMECTNRISLTLFHKNYAHEFSTTGS